MEERLTDTPVNIYDPLNIVTANLSWPEQMFSVLELAAGLFNSAYS